jgi:phospholipid transport system substrate-binding protein
VKGLSIRAPALVLTLFASLAVAAESPSTPHEVIRQTGDALIKVIEEGKGYFDADPERFYREVRGVLDPVIDFDSFARGVMAVNFKRATPEQRARFRDTFKDALVRTYGKALLNYGNERIDVVAPTRPPRQPDRESVTMEVHSEGRVYPVVYSMQQDGSGRWRVGNVIINGINMGLTYRNQFAAAMKAPRNRGDIDLVIADWGTTVADVDPMAEGGDERASGNG